MATFTCPPCSLRCSRTASSPSHRLTYCSIIAPNASLQCFRQDSGEDYNVSASSIEIRKPSKPIIHLDTIVDVEDAEGTAPITVLTIHEDSEVRCYSEGLERELWASRIGADNQQLDSSTRVEAAYTMPFDQAQKTILKGREDLLANFARTDHDHAVTVLALFTRRLEDSDSSLSLRLLRLGGQSDREALTSSRPKPMQEIAKTTIPGIGSKNGSTKGLLFHPASGTLYQQSPDRLVISEILGMVPRVVSEIGLDIGKTAACLRISSSLVLVNTTSSLSIIDIKYSSVQAQHLLQETRQTDSAASAKKKGRKQNYVASNGQALSYFAPSGVIVALQGRQLVAFHFTSSYSKARKRKSEVLLKDAIGHGTMVAKKVKTRHATASGSKSFGTPIDNSDVDDDWQKEELLLDKCFAENKLDEIEPILDAEFRVAKSSSELDRAFKEHPRKQAWMANSLDRRKIHYLLSKVFLLQDEPAVSITNEANSERSLRMYDVSPRIRSWLLRYNNLSVNKVEIALRHKGFLAAHERLKPGALIDAIARQDPSLKAVSLLLNDAASLTALEITCALRLAIAQIQQADQVKLLTSAGVSDPSVSDNDSASDMQDHKQEPLDNHALSEEHAQRTETAHRVFVTAISRLYRHSPHSVSSALRNTLSRPELHSLVDVLRMELARNGWLASHFDDHSHASITGGPKPTDISVIAHLLNCVMDGLGSGGWVSGTSLPDDLAEATETLAYMKVEISAALEGIMEATYLQGMLEEMLLCGKSMGPEKAKNQAPHMSNGQVARGRTGIVQIGVKGDALLPLGLKATQKISEYRVGAGGELIKRSKRDVARLQNKTVPKYSFERIMI